MELLRATLEHWTRASASLPLVVQAVLVIVALAAMSLGPGMLVLGRLRLRPLEKLCCAAGLSLTICFLAGFALFLGAAGIEWQLMIPIISVACLLICARPLWRIIRQTEGRSAVIGFVIVLLWSGAILALIRHHSGMGWSSDWVEHHDRVRYLLGELPLNFRFLEAFHPTVNYDFIERPPLMNMLAATAVGAVARSAPYELVQVAFLYLNLLLFLPALWLARITSGQRRPVGVTVALIALFLCNPMVQQNATYLWTKLLTAFYVLLGTCLYLRGWKRRDALRMMGAIGALAAAIMVHYSAAVYAAVLAMHYLFSPLWQPRRRRFSEMIGGLAVACLLAGPWALFGINTFGVKSTLASNENIRRGQKLSWQQNLQTRAVNYVSTLIPHLLRADVTPPQESPWGWLRDSAFAVYQLTFPMAIGVVAGLLAAALWIRGTASRREPPAVPMLGVMVAVWLALMIGGIALLGYAGRTADAGATVDIGLALQRILAVCQSWPAALICSVAATFLVVRGSFLALPRGGTPIRRFWFVFILGSALLGSSLASDKEWAGQAHLCLQPLVYMGLALVAAHIGRMGLLPRLLLAAGLLVDFSLGVLLHAQIQNQVLGADTHGLSFMVEKNWHDKLKHDVRFLGDHVDPSHVNTITGLLIAGAITAVAALLLTNRKPRSHASGPPDRQMASASSAQPR